MALQVTSEVAWILVAVAVVVWGSFTAPMRYSQKSGQLHPLVFQSYMSLAIALSSLVALGMEKPSFTPWGLLGAGLWVTGNTCAIAAVERLGIGAAQGIWGGLICIVSFVWGATGRSLWADQSCTVSNMPVALIGLAVVCLGITGVSVVSAKFGGQTSGEPDPLLPDGQPTPVGDKLERLERDTADALCDAEYSAVSSSPAARASGCSIPRSCSSNSLSLLGAVEFGAAEGPEQTPVNVRVTGTLLAVCTSLLAGSCLVPVKFAPADVHVGYAVPFGVGTVLVSGLLVMAHWAASTVVELQPLEWSLDRKVLGASLLSGLLWNVGNVASILVAGSSLGLTVGYPLMQSALVVGGLWGICVYREITGAKPIVLFLLSAIVIAVGAVLLGMNGACKEDK